MNLNLKEMDEDQENEKGLWIFRLKLGLLIIDKKGVLELVCTEEEEEDLSDQK